MKRFDDDNEFQDQPIQFDAKLTAALMAVVILAALAVKLFGG